jgi:hypothetical protein
MSHSHPMLQPTSWAPEDHPDQVALNQPKDRAAIYRIIWQSSLACAMRPPVLRHTRAVWRTETGIRIAAATLQPIDGKEGYWLERKDFPVQHWPLNPEIPKTPVVIEHLYLRAQGVSPGQIIEGIFAAGITTPASIVSMVQALLGSGTSTTPLLKFESIDGRKFAKLTNDGAERLRIWRSAGLIGRVRLRNEVVDAVDNAELNTRDALKQMIHGNEKLAPIADIVARQIDAICTQWRGMSRHEGLLEISKATNKPPTLNALPEWMDPERILSMEHPLRRLREKMESELALADPAWRVISEAQRGQKRLRWLQENANALITEEGSAELKAALDPVSGQFSGLRYWLTGLAM